MRQSLYVLLLLLPSCVWAGEFDGVTQLAKRRVPWLVNNLVFAKKEATGNQEAFQLTTQNGKLVISATGPNAAAVGLNWYLKYYCHRSMSHMGDNLSPVNPLPVVKEAVTIDAMAQYRFALNYCTYNYTMSFYNWSDWEHELDWMALNGVNLMLVANGSEAVWQNALRKLGYGEKEIAAFITGPAYNAWWLMGNIEGWGGPMPQSQIDSRKVLVQKMIGRMQILGIEPVMPGFENRRSPSWAPPSRRISSFGTTVTVAN
jgi:alpha-N-acetylglucosaminidase